MDQYHEPVAELSPLDRDFVRALPSLKEELEAINWYHQRVVAASDPQIKAIMAHNRDEEKEHAAMTLEWLRRNDPVLDKHLRTYLFTTGSVVAVERAAEHGGGSDDDGGDATGTEGSLAIGDLKGDA